MVSESQTSKIQLHVLDISKPITKSCLSNLSLACKEWGFFHIKNHGLSLDLDKKIKLVSNQVFNLPCEKKMKIGPFSSLNTYTPPFIASPFFEILRVSGPDFLESSRSSADALFDQHNHEFSEIVQKYGAKMTELSEKIVKIVLTSLGEDFEEKFYDSEFKNCHGYLRINNYLPRRKIQENQEEDQETEGLGKHTDMSCITILYQDQIGGLQVRSKEGKWMDISPFEGTLVVNIGDMLQAWSNDRFRSSEHKVILKKSTNNRFSIAFFWCFEDHKVILAPNEVVGNDGIRVYNPFVNLDYLKFRESNVKGDFEKVSFTVKDFAGI